MSAVHALMLAGLLSQGGGQGPGIVERAHINAANEVNFHAMALPETVYVGQAVSYELGVFISDEMRQRLRKNPEFVPPELRSVLAYDLHDRGGSQTIVREGRTYEVHVFRRALFPLAPGRVDIPPARLSYSVPQGSSFFSKEEDRHLRSEPVHFVAIAPPMAGRPAHWASGAVGDLRLTTMVSAKGARVGDPFVLTLRVSGSGNVNLWPRPELAISWASIVPGGERVSVDSNASEVRGAKDFDWLVTPDVDGSVRLPSVGYPYFDPSARAYRVASSESRVLAVNAGGLVSVDSVAPKPTVNAALPVRTAWSRGWPDAPDNTLWFWIVFAVAPLPVVVRALRTRPRRRAADSPETALRALAREANPDVARVRSALRTALDIRLGRTPIPWADPIALPRALRHYGITDETIRVAMALFARIDSAAFGGTGAPLSNVASSAVDLYDDIDREALAAGSGSHVAIRAGVLGVLLLASTLVAQTAQGPRAYFDRAVTTYTAGSPGPAAADFLRAAQGDPNVGVAWANAGTASWTVGDTALAVVGWQRALRLDPLDEEIRDRLSSVGADAGAGNDVVWPIPRRLLAWLGLIVWLGAWVAVWRRRHTRIALVAAAVAAILAAASRAQHARLTDSHVAVVARPAPLRNLPALGAEAGPTPLTGELVRVIDRSGVWARVAASGGREGWIDGGRLLTLDARPLRD